MKKLLFILPFILCGCVSECYPQVPSQTLYVGSSCSATLPDYTKKVTATDNCQMSSVTQSPAAGYLLTATNQKTTVTLTATDAFGNKTQAMFTVTLVDTIPPVILYNEASAEADHDKIMQIYDLADSLLIKYNAWWNNQFPWDSLGIARNDTILINYKLIVEK